MVSIIIPIYNTSSKLSRCVDSVLNQTFSDIEVLLIDDGSTDDSADICKRYAEADSRVRYYFKENGGSASARNFGIDKASGEYIQFVDSDDYIDAEMSSEMVSAITEGHSDLAICGITYHTHYNTRTAIFGSAKKLGIDEFSRYVIRHYNSGIIHSSCTKLYKRELITCRMNPEFRLGEDYLFNLAYLLNARSVSIIDKPLYNYDCSGESVTRGKYKSRKESIESLYSQSIVYLEKIFHSDEVISVASYQCIVDLLSDLNNTISFLDLNNNAVEAILKKNDVAVARIIPSDKLSALICAGRTNAITRLLRKDKFLSFCRLYAKRLINAGKQSR